MIRKLRSRISMRTMSASRKCYIILFLICVAASTYFLVRGSDNSADEFLQSQAVVLPQNTEVNKLYFEIANLKKELARLKKNSISCNLATKEIEESNLPVIYAITPTYARPEQKAELTRLYQTLLLVPALHWVVIEDAPSRTALVTRLLNSSGMSYTHVAAHTPPQQKLGAKDAHWTKPRGVLQRNTALEWLHTNLDSSNNGVIYFADDDNSYSLQLFEEMRWTKRVSVWPVGLVGGLMVERPIPNMLGKVHKFNVGYKPERPFPIDMAGFGINLQLLLSKPDARFLYEVEPGFQESQLLKQLTTREQLEVKADNCTKVYVWHTRTEKPKMREELQWRAKGRQRSDYGIEV